MFFFLDMKQQANIKFRLNLGKQPQKHTKCSKLFIEMLYLVHMTLNGLQDSETIVRTLMMIQGVTSHRLPGICKQLQNFIKLAASDHQMTIKLIKYQLHIKWEMIHQILHDDSQKRRMCIKCLPHNLMDEQNEHTVAPCEDFIHACHSINY
jgi:hypothetical protein